MRVLYFGYRDWARRLLSLLHFNANRGWEICGAFSITSVNHEKTYYYDYLFDPKLMNDDKIFEKIKEFKPDYLLFVGWSWIVGERLLNTYPCLCLHPSPLPKYRGGSPLQHQIINGETKSAMTLFQMTDGIDDGPILAQQPLFLEGDLCKIFDDMYKVGTKVIIEALDGLYSENLIPKPQNEDEATTFSRRKPSQSKLCLQDFEHYTCEELYNFIRCLADPYPNAYLEDETGKLLFKQVDFIRRKE